MVEPHTQERLYESMATLMDGMDIADLVPVVAYMFAELVAEETNFVADRRVFSTAVEIFSGAYQKLVSPQQDAAKSVTLN